MRVIIEVKLTEIQLTDAVNRLLDLVKSKAPDSSENTTIKARFDDVIAVLDGIVNRKEIKEDEEGPYWLQE